MLEMNWKTITWEYFNTAHLIFNTSNRWKKKQQIELKNIWISKIEPRYISNFVVYKERVHLFNISETFTKFYCMLE